MSRGRDLRAWVEARRRTLGRLLARLPTLFALLHGLMLRALRRVMRALPLPERATRRRWSRRVRRSLYTLWQPVGRGLGWIGAVWFAVWARIGPWLEARARWVLAALLVAGRWLWPRVVAALSPLAPIFRPIVERLTPLFEAARARWWPVFQQRILVARMRLRTANRPIRGYAGSLLLRVASALLGWPGHELERLSRWVRAGRWQPVAMVAALYAFVAFWMTAPTWAAGGHQILVGGGENPDWTGTAWAYWWTSFSFQRGLNPFDGTWDFYPVGQRPVAMYNLLDGVMGAPFMLIFGPVLGYNLFALFTMWSSALAMWVLGRSVGVSRGGAVLAGLALETSNFMCFELRDGRLSQTLLLFWILGLAGLERLARGVGTWRLAVVTGLAVAGAHMVYWYNGFFLILAATPLWLAEWRRWDVERFKKLGLAAFVTLLTTGPYLISLAKHFRTLPGVERKLESWMDYGELGRGVFGLNSAIRHSHWPLWPLIHPPMEPDDHRIAIAVVVLGLGGLLFKRARGHRRWLGVMLVGYTLTLGPYLKGYAETPTPVRLPYLLLYDNVPFFDRLWWPGRMALIALLPLCLLAAVHLDRLAGLWPRWRNVILALGVGAVLVDADSRNPFLPIAAREPHSYDAKFYGQLDGALITTPVLGRDPAGRHHLWYQIFHQRPILYGLGAHIPSHRPLGYEAYIHNNTLLDALATVSDSLSKEVTVRPRDITRLIDDGFQWVVVDANAFTEDYATNFFMNFVTVMARIYGQPDVQSSKAVAWRLRPISSPVIIPILPPAGPEEYGKAPVQLQKQ